MQTDLDAGADSCATRYYHDTMLAHGGHSELMILPETKMRCAAVGQPGDAAVPKAVRLRLRLENFFFFFFLFCFFPSGWQMTGLTGGVGLFRR